MFKHPPRASVDIEETDRPTVFAFVAYQSAEDDKMLNTDSFTRKCPSCSKSFDVRSISEHFKVKFTAYKSGARLFPCTKCVDEISNLVVDEFRNRGERALQNVERSVDPNNWAVTTDLAVLSHGGDEVAAIVYGCLLSDQTVNDYDQGKIDLSLFVFGMHGDRNG